MIPLGLLIVMYALVVCAVGLAAAPFVISAVQKKRATRPVEYYPPRGFSPIDVMIEYFGSRANMRELFDPLMLFWADHGFIEIEEDCKRGLKLTKLKPLEPVGEKDARRDQTYRYEKQLFDDMFADKDVFYTLAATSAHENDYKKFCKNCKNAAQHAMSPLGRRLALINAVFSSALMVLMTMTVGAVTKNTLFVAMLFPIVAVFFMIAFRLMDGDVKINVFKHFFFALWGGAPMGVALASTRPEYAVAVALSIALAYLAIHVLFERVDIRNEKDIEYYGRIDSFKRFLLEAEQDKLELLVEDDPDWFFDILPFCYILKITDKLKNKFDRIMLDGPSRYLGNMRDILMF